MSNCEADPIGQLGELFANNERTRFGQLETGHQTGGDVITRWMEQSDTFIIATSRVKIRIPIEHSFPLQPLTVLEHGTLHQAWTKAKPSSR